MCRVRENERADQLAGEDVKNYKLAGMVVIWEDILTLFALSFHFCLCLSVLTATESSFTR
jgi:hypothetical protein